MIALGALLALAAAAASAAPPAPTSVAPEALEVRGFGQVTVHPPPAAPARVVLLLSGAGGRDAGAESLADALAARGALVASVDTPAYLAARTPGRCAYPAGDLEDLAQHVEKVRGLEAYQRPILVGYSRGAVVAWAALAQAPPGTFAGAVAVAPCPGRPLPFQLCAGSGPRPRQLEGGDLPVLARTPAPFEVIAGASDAKCPAPEAERFAADLGARFTVLPGEGHGLSPAALEAIQAALLRVGRAGAAPPSAPASVPAVSDLPVVEVAAKKPGVRLAVLLTGDGGWVGIDKALAAAFADAGVATVGLDSLRYFWKKRTPDETARDVGRIVDHYRAAWKRPEVILVGYSRGADIVPFIPPRLTPSERSALRLVAMLGPSTFAEFEVHAIDLFSSRRRRSALPTEEAVRATSGTVRMLCVHGADEHDSLCPHLGDLPWVKDVLLPGGHHFDEGYDALARMVLQAVPESTAR